ncbi:unnamed protein product, partial [Didymodactylos carnosus]
MDENTSCFECRILITQRGYRCAECTQFFKKDILFCEGCFPSFHKETKHQAIPFDHTNSSNNRIINSIIKFENSHILIPTGAPSILFPVNDENSSVWKRSDFSEISYLSANEKLLLKDSIPFICDYLRMNNSLQNLISELHLNICSTDIIISILKYSSFDIRISIIEQLSMFQRPIPIYFGVPSNDHSSIKYYFLMHETLHALLSYSYQKTPFVLSFGSSSCRDKTILLNKILKTNFDCHNRTEFNSEKASNYYHNQLIQIILGHQYLTVSGNDHDIRHTYRYHVLDLHGFHDWNQMPNLFIQFMSVIMIHIDVLEVDKIDSFSWNMITFNRTATYIIFIHGQVLDSKVEALFHSIISKYFGPNEKNVHFVLANPILKAENNISLLGLVNLLKQATVPSDLLFNISEKVVKEKNINLSTSISALIRSRGLLEEFRSQLNTLSSNDPALDLFPLCRLKEISEKIILSSENKQLKDELTKKRHDQAFKVAHPILIQLAERSINDENDMNLFEKSILLWNTTLWEKKQQEEKKPPLSIWQQLEMSKERFLREFQERSREYKNLNGTDCSFDDKNLMKQALIKIYRHAFEKQQYIEIINATSSTVYPEVFQEAFLPNFDLKGFFVIGIIGEQSGGKSFAMNKIFGTKTAESKFKCTTGILATRVKVIGHEKVKNIVILDTEGLLDRTKKDAEAQIFDRKIVLQVMARSHLVLINITRNVNKTIQKILEVVLYGLNKLEITNKPKLIFLFRDQDPSTMGVAGQRGHVEGVINDINEACQNFHFDVTEFISGYDIHEFSSPFADVAVGERVISFFSHNFCLQALSLRRKIIEQLSSLKPYPSFEQWVSFTLELWKQINQNSNLFDYESLLHLTLEKDLEAFCNHILTTANDKMRDLTSNILENHLGNIYDDDQILATIRQQLAEKKNILKKTLLETELPEKKIDLMRKYNLQLFPEALWNSTTSRIMSSIDLYETDYCMAAKRQVQQDDFQRKLHEIPKDLSRRIKEIQNVAQNTTQFENLFNNTSTILKNNFRTMLKNDYKKQAESLQYQLIENFLRQNSIDNVGEQYFRFYIGDEMLKQFVEITLNQHLVSTAALPISSQVVSLIQPDSLSTSLLPHGTSFWKNLLTRFSHKLQKFLGSKNSNSNVDCTLEEMLSVLNGGYRKLRNSLYYDNNLLPIPTVANDSVEYIQNRIKRNNLTNQDLKNFWITCYGIMLNLFCENHRNYIIKKLTDEFDQEIIRSKEEVRQSITNATTAEEHGEALIKQIWAIIENDIEKHFQNQLEIFFSTWNDYRPSIIAENCVNQLFRSKNYQLMWKYIKNPIEYVKDWLRTQFNDQYKSQLTKTINSLALHLKEKKKQFLRMILSWKSTIEASNIQLSNTKLNQCLIEFLTNGKYVTDDFKLEEGSGGFSSLQSKTIRTIPEDADKYHLLRAIQSTSEKIESGDNKHVTETMEKLINSEPMKDRLFEGFYNKAKGCGTPCPYCKQMCDNDNENHTEHRSSYHLLWVFTGYRGKDTKKPSLICCTSNEAFERTVQSITDNETYIPFSDHIKRFNSSWKIINLQTQLEDFQLKAYIALEEDLAQFYNFEGRADVEIRKKFLRTVVTAYCYSLLIGIDYENTPHSLDGIPTFDVSCIEKQLMGSSIAYAENICVLKNDEATKDKILDKLQNIVDNLDERSTFIFYFA